MKLSERRKRAIYDAVHERLVRARILLSKQDELRGTELGRWVDFQVAQAMDDAADAAVRAAEGGRRGT